MKEPSLKEPIILFSSSLAILLFGIYILYGIDSSIDYDILNNEFITNQTFVNSLDCEKIIMSINVLENIFSPTQQDEVTHLIKNFENLGTEKGCIDDFYGVRK